MRKSHSSPIPQITTIEQADAHQRKHGFKPLIEAAGEIAQKVQTLKETTSGGGKAAVSGRLRNVRKREMNKTEREFSHILEAQKRENKIADWRFEGVRLLWGGGMTYTADFSVRRHTGRITLIEVKGSHIFTRDTVRFKGCRNEWEVWFNFEFHQRAKDGTWNQLL